MRRSAPILALLLAAPSDGLDLSRPTLSGGAGESVGSTVTLSSTVAEAAAVGLVQGGPLTLSQGFWVPVGPATSTGVVTLPAPAAIDFLGQSYPNPFRDAATIRFSLAREMSVRVTIFDVAGRRVTSLVDEERPAGWHTVRWNGRDDAGRAAASGVYFYRLESRAWTDTKRMLKLR